MRGGYQDYVLDYHPFDVVGWDGYVYPYTFNIADFEPKAGRLHQPPPAHQTFQGPNFVICSFCPRMLDWDAEAIAAARTTTRTCSPRRSCTTSTATTPRARASTSGAITLHPSGLPHGPQPGAVEKSLGATRTDELAVMCDTFRPLQADDAVARPRRPVLRVLVVRGVPGDGVRRWHLGRVGDGTAPFVWRDGERLIRFGRGTAAEAVELLGGPGYALLTTERARRAAPRVGGGGRAGAPRAGRGACDELAAATLAGLRAAATRRASRSAAAA